MTRIVWNEAGTNFFETGVDRGVLYPSVGPGVPWNGLQSVTESPIRGDIKNYYLDGIKFLHISSFEEFEASILALSAPRAFRNMEGVKSIANGLYASQQKRDSFGFSYRTLIGNDISPDVGYKIHLVYNAIAKPNGRTNTSVNATPTPISLGWSISSIPISLPGYRPTSHFVIDTRDIDPITVQTIENALYGTIGIDSQLILPSELITLLS